MGGISFSVTIEKLRDDAQPLAELHDSVWSWMAGLIHRTCKKRANDMVLVDYLGSTASDGLGGDEYHPWDRDEHSLSFSFWDAAGLCGASCEISYHWARLAFASQHPRIQRTAKSNGWRVAEPEQRLADLLRAGPSWPVVYVSGGIFLASLRKPGTRLEEIEDPLWADDSYPRPKYHELRAPDRAVAEWAAMTGLCQCDLCVKLGRRAGTYIAPDAPALRSVWEALERPEAAAVEAATFAPLSGFAAWDEQPAGPAELQVLSDLVEEQGASLPAPALGALVRSRQRMRARGY